MFQTIPITVVWTVSVRGQPMFVDTPVAGVVAQEQVGLEVFAPEVPVRDFIEERVL